MVLICKINTPLLVERFQTALWFIIFNASNPDSMSLSQAIWLLE